MTQFRAVLALVIILAAAGARHGLWPARGVAAPIPITGWSTASSDHVFLGTPVDADPSDDHLITRPQYVVSYNPKLLIPNWASWQLQAKHFGGARRHKGHFLSDTSLPSGWYRVTHDDYTGSSLDRGHLVRSEDRTTSNANNDSTFILTNVAPQEHDANGGPWLRLEEHCRHLAQGERRTLYIVAGVIVGSNPRRIGHGVAVPESFYKVVVDIAPGYAPSDASTRVIAVIVPNKAGIMHEPWTTYRTSVADVERRSGYRFFSALPPDVRRTLEQRSVDGAAKGAP